MALAQHRAVPPGEQQRHADHQHPQGRGDAVLGELVVAGIGLEVDEGAEHVDAVAETDDGRDVEGGDGDGGHVDDRGENRRKGQRQGHPAHGGEEAHAVDLGGFLQGRVHGPEHLSGEDERQRRQAQPLDEAHAHRSRDVDGTPVQAEQAHQPAVEETDALVRQEGPSHGRVDARYQQAESHDGVDQALARQGGAFGKPGDGQTDGQSHQRGGHGEDQRVVGDLGDERIGQDLAVVPNRVGGVRCAQHAGLEADPHQHGHQHQDHEHRYDGQPQHPGGCLRAERAEQRSSQDSFHRGQCQSTGSRRAGRLPSPGARVQEYVYGRVGPPCAAARPVRTRIRATSSA